MSCVGAGEASLADSPSRTVVRGIFPMRAARFCIRTSKKGKVKDGIDSQSVKASRVRPVIVTLTDRSKDGRFRANVPHADMQHGTLLSNTIKHVPSTRPRRQ